MEFQSIFPTGHRRTEKVVVYDPRDGRIYLVHDFIGDGQTGVFGPQGREERARIALESARRHVRTEALEVLHVPSDFDWDRHSLYKVNLQEKKLEVRARMFDHDPL